MVFPWAPVALLLGPAAPAPPLSEAQAAALRAGPCDNSIVPREGGFVIQSGGRTGPALLSAPLAERPVPLGRSVRLDWELLVDAPEIRR